MRPFFRFHVTGRENIPDGGVLFAINHTSLVDAPLAWVILKRDLAFLATAGLFRIPVLNWVLRFARCIPVDRHAFGKGGAHEGMFGAIERAYKLQRDIAIFPQGGIVPHPQGTTHIKRGIERIAQIGYPVVPLTLRGARGSFPWVRHVVATIHPAVPNDGTLRDTLAKLFVQP